MADAPVVDIVGLRALARDVKALTTSNDLLSQMREAARKAAAPVAAAIASAVPHDTGTLAGTVRTSATRTGAGIRMGGIGGVAYAGPVDFGGWPAGREYLTNGRYMFPIAHEANLAAAAAADYSDAITRAVNSYDWSNATTDPAAVHD